MRPPDPCHRRGASALPDFPGGHHSPDLPQIRLRARSEVLVVIFGVYAKTLQGGGHENFGVGLGVCFRAQSWNVGELSFRSAQHIS